MIPTSSMKRKGPWLELTIPQRELTMSLQGDQELLARWLISEMGMPAKLLKKLYGQKAIVWQDTRLLIQLFPDEAPSFEPVWMDLDVLYEDDFCLVVNKRAGLAVHPTSPEQTDTLAHGLASYYASTGQACKVRPIHRLDRDTSGGLLYAKNEWAQLQLDEAMRTQRVERHYIAVVEGKMKAKRGTIDQSIGRDRHHASRQRISTTGKEAITHFQCKLKQPQASLVELELETGRTHQIRVHMSHLGHPLIGDELYGAKPHTLNRQALHASRLRFPHPLTGEWVEVQSPWPEDLRALAEVYFPQQML